MKIFLSIFAMVVIISGVSLAALISPEYEGVSLSNGIVVGGPPGASKIGAGGAGTTYWDTPMTDRWDTPMTALWDTPMNTEIP